MDLDSYREKAQETMARFNLLKEKVKDERQNLKKIKERVRAVTEAQQIVQTVAQQIQEQAHQQIAAVVTRCLEAVYDEPYQFQIVFDKKRGRTEARLVFLRDGFEIDPRHGVGGGVLDVASFALRVACLLLQRPNRRRLVIADEPFRWLSSPVHRDRIANMVRSLAEEFGIQFILVIQTEELEIGKVIRMGGVQENGT